MILNGKAKIDFENYIRNLEVAPYVVMLDEIPKCYLYALIIEWLDSVKIFISISKLELSNGFSYSVLSEKLGFGGKEKTRQEATEKAIEKAVEIYNNQNKTK